MIPIERIQQTIYLIRGRKVMLDSDLAIFYAVKTKELNKAVSRNKERFPSDFVFQLSIQEVKDLIFQFGMSKNSSHGGRRTRPYAFTEQGVAMLSAVLKTKRATIVSVQIMRSFVKLRELLQSNEVLAKKLKELESRTDEHAQVIMEIIKELQKPHPEQIRKIGF
jgi:hypothetical protein